MPAHLKRALPSHAVSKESQVNFVMISKAIYFLGGTIAMSTVWLFALVWVASACCDVAIEGTSGLVLWAGCACVAAAAAWKLFVNPSN
jgi:arginine exporter protein ArgO